MSTKSKKRASKRTKAKKRNRGFTVRGKRRVIKLAKMALRKHGGVIPFGSPAWNAVSNVSNVTERKGRRRKRRLAHYV